MHIHKLTLTKTLLLLYQPEILQEEETEKSNINGKWDSPCKASINMSVGGKNRSKIESLYLRYQRKECLRQISWRNCHEWFICVKI